MMNHESQRQFDAAIARRAKRRLRPQSMCANGPTPSVPPMTRDWIVRFTMKGGRAVETYRRPPVR